MEILSMPKHTINCSCGCIYQWETSDLYTHGFSFDSWVRYPICRTEVNLNAKGRELRKSKKKPTVKEMERELDERTKQLLMDALQYSSNKCN